MFNANYVTLDLLEYFEVFQDYFLIHQKPKYSLLVSTSIKLVTMHVIYALSRLDFI
jgi:hypothetical protein